jgi:hypothetical protein
MKPKNKVKLDVPLPGDWQAYDAKFRAHLAEAAKNVLLSKCTEDWIDAQHIAHLQLMEKERRRKVDEEIKQIRLKKKAEKASQQSPPAETAPETTETTKSGGATGKSESTSSETTDERKGAAPHNPTPNKEAAVATGRKVDWKEPNE